MVFKWELEIAGRVPQPVCHCSALPSPLQSPGQAGKVLRGLSLSLRAANPIPAGVLAQPLSAD